MIGFTPEEWNLYLQGEKELPLEAELEGFLSRFHFRTLSPNSL